MKEKLAALWAKVVENKIVVIKAGVTLAGALIGAGIATLIEEVREDVLMEEMALVSLDEEETT